MQRAGGIDGVGENAPWRVIVGGEEEAGLRIDGQVEVGSGSEGRAGD